MVQTAVSWSGPLVQHLLRQTGPGLRLGLSAAAALLPAHSNCLTVDLEIQNFAVPAPVDRHPRGCFRGSRHSRQGPAPSVVCRHGVHLHGQPLCGPHICSSPLLATRPASYFWVTRQPLCLQTVHDGDDPVRILVSSFVITGALLYCCPKPRGGWGCKRRYGVRCDDLLRGLSPTSPQAQTQTHTTGSLLRPSNKL